MRTTILLRREQRREQVAQVKQSAANGARSLAAKAWRLSKTSLAGAYSKSKNGLIAAASALWTGLSALGGWLGRTAAASWRIAAAASRKGLAPLSAILTRPGVQRPIAFTGWLAGLAGLWQTFAHGFGVQAKWALLLSATALLLAYGPQMIRRVRGLRQPDWLYNARRSVGARVQPLRGGGSGGPGKPAKLMPRLAPLAGVLVLGVIGWFGVKVVRANLPSLANLTSSLPLLSPMPAIEGRAVALTGDILRIGDKLVRLEGVEAPEPVQRCKRGKRSWRCGRSARSALAKAARRKTLRCQPSGKDVAGRLIATCFAGDTDINALLVRQGSVFAADAMLAKYATQEEQARNAKAGIWKGTPERPAAYRDRKWQEAKAKAPNGCPIKGNITRSGKIYVLPWAGNYDRVAIRTTRGERWFCSEANARSAGWRSGRES